MALNEHFWRFLLISAVFYEETHLHSAQMHKISTSNAHFKHPDTYVLCKVNSNQEAENDQKGPQTEHI